MTARCGAFYVASARRSNVDRRLWMTVMKSVVTRPGSVLGAGIADQSQARQRDAGLVSLTEMTKLKELYLGKIQITDAGVAELKKALPRYKSSFRASC